ncbi:MAG: hypothetical protein ACE5LU_19375 [Anaerolineae bacterium]
MIYQPELYYFWEQEGFPFRKAVSVTAQTVAIWCNHYHAKLIAPSKSATVREQKGELPEDVEEKGAIVEELVNWILEDSVTADLFTLFLDSGRVPQEGRVAKFDHHDDTCCWVLNLTEQEFKQLRMSWEANGLPTDLFYPEGQGICVPYDGTGIVARWLKKLGFKRCYTPKQWAVRQSGMVQNGPKST